MPLAIAPGRSLRSPRERVLQTLSYEAIGLLIVTPLWASATGASIGESLRLLMLLSVAAMAVAATYNALFDQVEHRRTSRVASDRPPPMRLLHAVGLEAATLLLTWPLIVALTPLGAVEALVADLGLTLAYVGYGYAFHLGFDRLRPVR